MLDLFSFANSIYTNVYLRHWPLILGPPDDALNKCINRRKGDNFDSSRSTKNTVVNILRWKWRKRETTDLELDEIIWRQYQGYVVAYHIFIISWSIQFLYPWMLNVTIFHDTSSMWMSLSSKFDQMWQCALH